MERILVIKLYAIGDLVMSLPGIGLLRSDAPASEIHLLTSGLLAPLARLAAPVDRVIEMDDRILGRSARRFGLLPLALRLRRECYSSGYLLHRMLPLRLFLRLAGPRQRTGQGTGTAGLTRAVPFETGQPEHDAQRYARVFGWDGKKPLAAPLVRFEESVAEDLMPVCKGKGPVAVSPGGGRSTVRSTDAKRWPPERFGEIIRMLHREGFGSVLLGSAEDGGFLEELRADLPKTSLDLIGRTSLVEAAGVLSRSRMLITNDSSLMHLAGLVGTPTLTVFGPTDPVRVGVFPPSRRHRHLIPAGVECSPCHPPRAVESCDSAECMLSVTVDRVWDEAMDMLAEDRAHGRAAEAELDLPVR
ncbi:MAG: glycosyltransferase family 9 protein [Candidatus Fermentibacteraceae bacterium]|nr:glycosyltransferase family 9 protein [Candidatus Fermentibacteraceae bacterium]MBN2609226.1 glycosyltransferase family 9 protein [Candidatus Fermentibacteraceae bacterium]